MAYINKTNYIKLEKELDNISKMNKSTYVNIVDKNIIKKIDKELAKDIKFEYGVSEEFILDEIKRRRKILNKKNKQCFKYTDIPMWYDKTRCPFCNSKLIKRWEGMVCINNCPLNFKLGKGWVYLNKDYKSSEAGKNINSIFHERRNYLQKEFIKLKQRVIIRDDYKCRVCGYCLGDKYLRKCLNPNIDELKLECHHIISASEEMALYLDEDNLITLCTVCHKKIHSKDKYRFCSKNIGESK